MITKIRLRVKGKFNVTKFYLAFDEVKLQIKIWAKLFATGLFLTKVKIWSTRIFMLFRVVF